MDNRANTSANLPFSNLCDVLRPLLIATGKKGRKALSELMAVPFKNQLSHLGSKNLKTPVGILRISVFNTNGQRQLHIALDITRTMGYVHGEVYKTDVLVSAAIAACATGRPLSVLCETPEDFPGTERNIKHIRTFTRSTRIKIASSTATVSLDDFTIE